MDYGFGDLGATLVARLLPVAARYFCLNSGPNAEQYWLVERLPDTVDGGRYLFTAISHGGRPFPYGLLVEPDAPV